MAVQACQGPELSTSRLYTISRSVERIQLKPSQQPSQQAGRKLRSWLTVDLCCADLQTHTEPAAELLVAITASWQPRDSARPLLVSNKGSSGLMDPAAVKTADRGLCTEPVTQSCAPTASHTLAAHLQVGRGCQ